MKFKDLAQTHDSYEPDLIKKLSLLYKGGYDLKKSVKMFLDKYEAESPNAYRERCRTVGYIPYFSKAVDHFVGNLFSKNIHVAEASDADNPKTLGSTGETKVYKLFASDADRSGHSIQHCVAEVFRNALIHGKHHIGIDFPSSDTTPANKLEEEILGTDKPYVYYIDPGSMINWKYDDTGSKFDFVVLRSDLRIQDSPFDKVTYVAEFKVWERKDNNVTYRVFRTKPAKSPNSYSQNEELLETTPNDPKTSFKEIPIIELCIPDGLAVGPKFGPIFEEFFQRRSVFVATEHKSLIIAPVVKLGPDVPSDGSVPAEEAQAPDRGARSIHDYNSKNVIVLGSEDDMKFVEPSGKIYELVGKELEKFPEVIAEMLHQMAATASQSNKSLGRSGVSKMQDRFATQVILENYADLVIDFIKHIFTCISSARNESIVWTVQGMDDFEITDREQLLAEAIELPNLNIPSRTFNIKYRKKVAHSLLESSSPEEMRQIDEEIEAGYDEMKAQHDLETSLLAGVEPDGDEPHVKEPVANNTTAKK